MKSWKKKALAVAGLLGLAPAIAACSGSEAASDPNSLTIKVSTELSGAACRPVADYSIGKDHALRLVNYRVTMTGPGEQDTTRIPTGEVLHLSGAVKKARGISLHNHDAKCAEMTVVWDQFECENEDRQKMACPSIVLTGGSEFKSVEVVPPQPE
ncbi:hypothetical protein EJC49_14290 [Aquibium carbonis]|uniref:Lipoprotein n=1 Tax=Aquibium carbonis TaxID=2495581 RepID=A0A3R9ZR18_9HYPH|nr:hypothetical protein [Aquibium carbonis]RST85705.1 hypothetical protein EJC49_14290 [Aquibium carbonis]